MEPSLDAMVLRKRRKGGVRRGQFPATLPRASFATKKIARSGVARPARENAIAVERDEHAGESSRDDSMDVAEAHLQTKVVVGSEVVREVEAREAVARLLSDGNSLGRTGGRRTPPTAEIDAVARNGILRDFVTGIHTKKEKKKSKSEVDDVRDRQDLNLRRHCLIDF